MDPVIRRVSIILNYKEDLPVSTSAYPFFIKQALLKAISCAASLPDLCVRRPGRDFTRKRILDFQSLIYFLISMERYSMKWELLRFFHTRGISPSASALSQQRRKLTPYAMQSVFRLFNTQVPFLKTFRGFHLLACDGTDLNIKRNPKDSDTAFNSGTAGHSCRGYNLFHLNALYDLTERRYLDACLQPGRKKNEFRAFSDMIDRIPQDFVRNSILIADRGFCSYNVLAHALEKGGFFLIRAKDSDSKGMIKNLPLPDSVEFDVAEELTLIRRNTRKLRCLPGTVRFIGKNVDFDFVEYGSDDTYRIKLRIVRIKVSDDSFECLVTNLPSGTFSAEHIRSLYHLRWGIETSFRELKYATWLKYFHSEKREFITQEIWARMILYNFCESITTHVVIRQKAGRKYDYQVNFTMAIHICQDYLRCKEGYEPTDTEGLISSYILPVRPDRNFARNVKFQMPASFLYR